MFRSIAAKVSLIVLFAVIIGYYDLPSKLQKIPYTPAAITDATVHLGLDLQGGSQLDYTIDLRKVPAQDKKQIVEGVLGVINKRVNSLGVSESNIYTSNVGDEQHLIVELPGIKDLDEAKKIVGKTIQLEFKEKKDQEDPNYKEKIRTQANEVLGKVKTGNFETVGRAEAQADPSHVRYEEPPWQFASAIPADAVKDAIVKAKIGLIPQLLEGSNGYTVDEGGVVEQKGYFIVNVQETRSTQDFKEADKEVQVSHLLVQYKGSERATESVTRTKEEALARAQELLATLKSGGSFDKVAAESSDEPGAKDSKGKLPEAVKLGGGYDAAFTTGALKLSKPGEISEVVESAFGYHIIRADNFTQYKYNQIFFSTRDDQWQPTELTGQQFERADVSFDNYMRPIVQIQFNGEGAKLFEKLTERNINKPIAIFVGGNLISAPNVNEKITGGSAVINGTFTVQQAQDLARDLNTGAIPAPVVFSGQYTIGATLGQEALNTSLKAGLIGILILAIFMILYYRLPGFVAVLALCVYTGILIFLVKSEMPLYAALPIAIVIFGAIVHKILQSHDGAWEKFLGFILACFILFFLTFLLSNPIVLTLAGIAGVILSIGMAVDANILIFERMKEELRAGRPLSAAIDVGFDRAWSSIRDSNFSSLITCAILFYFGSSIIQGFAFNLAAGILVSMFTAITVTKTLLKAFMKTKLSENLGLWGAPAGQKEPRLLHIVEKNKVWFSFSGVLLVVSVIAMVSFGLKLGIDFKGGALLDITFDKATDVTAVKQELSVISETLNKGRSTSTTSASPSLSSASNPLELGSSRVLEAPLPDGTLGRKFIINMEHIDAQTHDTILNSLETKFGNLTQDRFTTIGPVVGETLKRKAILAVILAMVAIVLYIAFAFRKIPKKVSPWKFGVCAIVALMHDVLIPVGIFAIFRLEVDALFITAILTVLGFSVHDTIVVFDRLRENLKYQEKDETFAHLANRSMSQTIARSINTSLTALITLTSLLIFGSPSIFNFILVLVVGIVVGTYSSIFIASPLLTLWQKNSKE